MQLCGDISSATVPTDPTKLEDTFSQLLDLTSARLKTLGLRLVFILIDNVDQLVVRCILQCSYHTYSIGTE